MSKKMFLLSIFIVSLTSVVNMVFYSSFTSNLKCQNFQQASAANNNDKIIQKKYTESDIGLNELSFKVDNLTSKFDELLNGIESLQESVLENNSTEQLAAKVKPTRQISAEQNNIFEMESNELVNSLENVPRSLQSILSDPKYQLLPLKMKRKVMDKMMSMLRNGEVSQENFWQGTQ